MYFFLECGNKCKTYEEKVKFIFLQVGKDKQLIRVYVINMFFKLY